MNDDAMLISLQDLQTAVGSIFLLSLYMLDATAPAPQNI